MGKNFPHLASLFESAVTYVPAIGGQFCSLCVGECILSTNDSVKRERFLP